MSIRQAFATRVRTSILALLVVFALVVLGSGQARAQYFGYGMGLYGYPGAAVMGYGYGMGYPGFGYGYGMGYPFYGGYGMGYGGFGYGGFGGLYPGMGYGYGLGYPGIGAYGAYYPYWNNPATLALGITPLAIQAGLMERGLRAGSTTSAPQATGIPLREGVYRIEIKRIDTPTSEKARQPEKPKAKPES